MTRNGYCKSTICCIRSCEVIKDEPQRCKMPEFESLSSGCPCERTTPPADFHRVCLTKELRLYGL